MDPTRTKMRASHLKFTFVTGRTTGSRMVGQRNILLLLFCCVPYTVLFPHRIEGNLLHFITAGQNIPLQHRSAQER